MIEPQPNESVESLKAREAVEDAVLAHSEGWKESDAAQEIKGACERLTENNAEPREDDSALVISVLAVGSLAVDVGGETEEIIDEMKRIADTLEEGGWDSLRAVHAL